MLLDTSVLCFSRILFCCFVRSSVCEVGPSMCVAWLRLAGSVAGSTWDLVLLAQLGIRSCWVQGDMWQKKRDAGMFYIVGSTTCPTASLQKRCRSCIASHCWRALSSTPFARVATWRFIARQCSSIWHNCYVRRRLGPSPCSPLQYALRVLGCHNIFR